MTDSDIVGLKDYIEIQFKMLRELLDQRCVGCNKVQDERFAATGKVQDERFAATGKVQDERFMSHNQRHEVLVKEVEDLKKYKATMEGKASQTSVLIALAFAAIGTIIGIVNLLIHH